MKKELSLLKLALKKIGNKEAENEVKDIINAVLNEADISELINSNNADWEDGEQAPSYLRKKAGMILAIKDWQDLENKFGENAVKAKKIWEDFAAKDSSGKYNESIDSFISFYRNKANLSGENSSTYKELKDLMKKPEVKKIEKPEAAITNYSISNYSDGTAESMYSKILNGISAPVTKNNIEYMKAWRLAEGGTASFNPFNTTQKWEGSTNYNHVGVKNYKTEKDGVDATVKTLLNGRYNDIVESLRSDNPPEVTAASDSLSVWGTGKGVLRVLSRVKSKGTSGIGGSAPRPVKSILGLAKHVLGGHPVDWFQNGYSGGPANHAKRSRGNWQSDNAWDLAAPEGTPVFSITDGTVVKVKNSTPSKDGKVYGMSVTVDGGKLYPSVFYTHLGSVAVSVGDKIKFGQQIGTIGASSDPNMPRHVHIGLDSGHISSLVSESGEIKMA